MAKVDFDFGGTQVLVTGGSNGIGLGIARAFRAANARVAITGRKAKVSDYPEDLSGFDYHQAEMTSEADLERLAGSFDRLDVLVNNAGASLMAEDEWKPEVFERALRLHLFASFRLAVRLKDRISKSRIEGGDEFRRLNQIIEENDGAVGLLWHEEVATVAFGYPYLGMRPHTLASLGESGEVIARMLQRFGFVVFRGGSTSGASRRREGTLLEMIEHMRRTRNVIYGLTVDGSKGPPYRMKTGGLVIARECGKPVVLVRTWYRWCLRLPTWDRMAFPLPFNRIRYYLLGPFPVPPSAATSEGLERFRDELEGVLIDLAARSYDDMGQRRPKSLVKRERA